MAPQLPADLDALLGKVTEDWEFADKVHKTWRVHAERQYESYRVFQDWRNAVRDATPRDRDSVRRDGTGIWDANLHIPYAFSTVETILAQMLAHRPRILIQPRDEEALGNTQNMEFLIDAQQERIHYELELQEIGKDGLILGLGWQKMYWENEIRTRKRQMPRLTLRGKPLDAAGYTVKNVQETITDDWTAERCDPFDMRHDPYAGRVKDCAFIVHRTWRNERYVRHMIETGDWLLPDGWDLEDLLGVGTDQRHYSETFGNRNLASGLGNWPKQGGRLPYEVWEYHDKAQVITVLGRRAIVRVGDNPCWGGEYPFQAYRPTTAANGLLYGIGEIEPLEHLIREMDTLRTQRRWAAALALQKVFAYQIGVVDPDDIKFGPGMLIGVNGDPNELLREVEVSDVKNSGYREEERLEGNIDRTSGVSDPLTGASAAGGTATEAQLVRAAASTRIQNKARRIEVEVIQTGGEYALELNQQKIIDNRLIRIPLPPQPYEAERRWAWRAVKPSELAGRMAVKVEGGSTMAENVPQNRQDAMQLANLMRGDPHINQRQLWGEVLKKFGYEHPDQWLVPESPQVPPEALQFLEDNGIDPQLIQMAVEFGQQQNPTGGQPPAPNDAPDPALQTAQANG